MARGFVYLAAVIDWFSRRVLAWRVSITMEAGFCVEAVEEALARHGKPEIFNTDQGSQFTGSVSFRGKNTTCCTSGTIRKLNILCFCPES
jgi:putative transposase